MSTPGLPVLAPIVGRVEIALVEKKLGVVPHPCPVTELRVLAHQPRRYGALAGKFNSVCPAALYQELCQSPIDQVTHAVARNIGSIQETKPRT